MTSAALSKKTPTSEVARCILLSSTVVYGVISFPTLLLAAAPWLWSVLSRFGLTEASVHQWPWELLGDGTELIWAWRRSVASIESSAGFSLLVALILVTGSRPWIRLCWLSLLSGRGNENASFFEQLALAFQTVRDKQIAAVRISIVMTVFFAAVILWTAVVMFPLRRAVSHHAPPETVWLWTVSLSVSAAFVLLLTGYGRDLLYAGLLGPSLGWQERLVTSVSLKSLMAHLALRCTAVCVLVLAMLARSGLNPALSVLWPSVLVWLALCCRGTWLFIATRSTSQPPRR